MIDTPDDIVAFEDIVSLALAELTTGPTPSETVKKSLLARVAETERSAVPAGFSFRFAPEDNWLPHPVPGIRMKVLAFNKKTGYATLLLDVAAGTRFPAHYHEGDEECFVLSGSVHTLGRVLGPGDFLHADAGTDHTELWTDEGAQVLLVVPREDYMPV